MFLDAKTSGETGQFAVRPDHPVAGNYDGNWISPIGSSDGAGRPRFSQLLCQLTIAPGLSQGNSQQCFPNILLKGRTHQIKFEREGRPLPIEIVFQLSFSLKQYRMGIVFSCFSQSDTAGIVIFPKDSCQPVIAGDELQLSYG